MRTIGSYLPTVLWALGGFSGLGCLGSCVYLVVAAKARRRAYGAVTRSKP